MRRTGNALLGLSLMLLCGVTAGCAGLPPATVPLPGAPAPRPATSAGPGPAIQQAAYCQEGRPGPAEATALAPPPAPLDGLPELTADALVEQVLARNPSLAQMVAAWQAAQARYPQVTSLDDPMFAATVGPA